VNDDTGSNTGVWYKRLVLYRVSVLEVKSGRISRRAGHLVIAMQYYPRFIRKEQVDEYLHSLAPARALFTEFKSRDRDLKDHNRAFEDVRYEERFRLGAEGAAELARLSELSKTRDVYLLCQCGSLERCHADLCLLMARHWFEAPTAHMRLAYPIFEKVLESLPRPPAPAPSKAT
jgi:uncharacterized protein YeaO (DUF488 family)